MGQPLEGSGRQASADQRCSRKDGWLPGGIWRDCTGDWQTCPRWQGGGRMALGRGIVFPESRPKAGSTGTSPLAVSPPLTTGPAARCGLLCTITILDALLTHSACPAPRAMAAPPPPTLGLSLTLGPLRGRQQWSPRPPVLPSCSAPQGQGASIWPTLWPGPWGMCQGGQVRRVGESTLVGFPSSQAAFPVSATQPIAAANRATSCSSEDPSLGTHPPPTPPPGGAGTGLEVCQFVQLGRNVKWN